MGDEPLGGTADEIDTADTPIGAEDDGSQQVEVDGTDQVAEDVAPSADDDPRSREELFAALVDAEATRDEFLNDLQRLQAEFENFRKRMMRQGTEQRQNGIADVATKLLDVLDDFDMAVLSVDRTNDVDALHKGLELVYAKFRDALQTFGLTRIDEIGVGFDPERHEAVQQVEPTGDEPDSGDGPVVVDVLRSGYELDGRVLRAAMVKVAG